MDVTRCIEDYDPDFKYTNCNVSHSWLMNYPNRLKPDPNILKVSSMRETFQEHELPQKNTKGKRKKLLEAFYRKIISEEILGDLDSEEVIIEEYTTDYKNNFQNPDDLPLPGETCSKNEKLRRMGKEPKQLEDKSKLDELKSKYPLYLSAPVTYFSQTSGKEKFGKKTTITKRPEENYDNIEY